MSACESPAESPEQLASDFLRADTVKLNFGGEIYQLTSCEIQWIAEALQAMERPTS